MNGMETPLTIKPLEEQIMGAYLYTKYVEATKGSDSIADTSQMPMARPGRDDNTDEGAEDLDEDDDLDDEDLDLYEAEVSEEISLVADPLVANPLVANPLVAEPTRQERVSLPVEEGPVDFPQPHSVSAPVTVPVSAPVSSLAKGDTYTYRMRVSLTVGSLAKLSKLIHKCRGRGSRVLQIETKEGVVLPLGDLGQILVNDVEFPLFALDAGL